MEDLEFLKDKAYKKAKKIWYYCFVTIGCTCSVALIPAYDTPKVESYLNYELQILVIILTFLGIFFAVKWYDISLKKIDKNDKKLIIEKFPTTSLISATLSCCTIPINTILYIFSGNQNFIYLMLISLAALVYAYPTRHKLSKMLGEEV